MKRLLFYLRLWRGYMRIGFLILVQYRADTIIMIISMLLREASGFIGVVTIANVTGGLGNWNIYEIILLFSMCAVIESISQSFLDNVWGIDHEIRKGMLDVLLVRPANPFIQMLGRWFHFTGLICLAAYSGMMFWAMAKLGITFHIGTILFLLEFIICATAINSGIYTIFNCMNFWLVQGSDLAEFVQTCREFAKYPLSVFPLLIRSFFTYMIPFGFIGYYPAAYLSGKAGVEILILMPVCALVVVGIAAALWKAGLRSYNSAGN